VSVDLPSTLADEIRAMQKAMDQASVPSFTDPEQAHVTLKFLCDVPSDHVDMILTALETALPEAGVAPFEATIGGLGVFPSEEYIRVVWVGFQSGATRLTHLHHAIEHRLTELGYEPESHEFTPHVTLGRMDHAGGKELIQALLREDQEPIGTMRVDEVRLTESELRDDGPVYSTVERFPLEPTSKQSASGD
jgi:2'-5' RNA ligase